MAAAQAPTATDKIGSRLLASWSMIIRANVNKVGNLVNGMRMDSNIGIRIYIDSVYSDRDAKKKL
jgi:hypothetical protein